MKLWKRFLVFNLAAGILACLLMAGRYDTDRSHILNQLAHSLAMTFLIATPSMLLLTRFGASMYRRRVPFNWILISATLLACATAASLIFNIGALTLGVLSPYDFWSSFWLNAKIAAVLSMIFGIGRSSAGGTGIVRAPALPV